MPPDDATAKLCSTTTQTWSAAASPSPTEATNALIKKVKRVGHGFRNFDNFRLRLLLAVGLDWRTVHWLRLLPRSGAADHA